MNKEYLKYKVIAPFSCPNTHIWHGVGVKLSMLGCEATLLLLSNKIEKISE
ncbi:hypothetical protein [uncultured Shewanella sp.]|uniref:hypothetical protein n=1 Tax=uncultured Shewanella sp. TaxID=173975 RepID=UPI00260E3744|nr:hypothetical protein [uncultured Shewanella sp.]